MDDEFNVYRDVDREASRDYDPRDVDEERPPWWEAALDNEPPVRGTRCAYCGWLITGSCDGRCLT